MTETLTAGAERPPAAGPAMFATDFDELAVGDSYASPPAPIEDRDVAVFAALTGDHHPIHVDPEWAATGPFGRPIAHGLLVLSLRGRRAAARSRPGRRAAPLPRDDLQAAGRRRRVGDRRLPRHRPAPDRRAHRDRHLRVADQRLRRPPAGTLDRRDPLAARRARARATASRGSARSRQRRRLGLGSGAALMFETTPMPESASPVPRSLEGKRLLITGVITKRSIAYAVAERAQAAGAEVLLTGFGRGRRMTERASRGLDPVPDVLELDVNRESDLELLALELGERWGSVDGVLHAIAFAPPDALGGSFMSAPAASAELAFRTSAYSLKALAEAVVPLMERGGSIVGLDFDASVAWPVYDWMGVAKAALESVNRYLCRDLGPRGIRSNLISAGPIETPAAGGIPGFTDCPPPGSGGRRWAGIRATRARSRIRPASALRCGPRHLRADPPRRRRLQRDRDRTAARLSERCRPELSPPPARGRRPRRGRWRRRPSGRRRSRRCRRAGGSCRGPCGG